MWQRDAPTSDAVPAPLDLESQFDLGRHHIGEVFQKRYVRSGPPTRLVIGHAEAT